MTTCRCGVDIRWCKVVGEPDKLVAIEPSITLTSGPDRYTPIEYGDRWTVLGLDPTDRSQGHPDHRVRCPR